jgi:hypothetical protein
MPVSKGYRACLVGRRMGPIGLRAHKDGKSVSQRNYLCTDKAL